ncbi:hypothetical protein DES37_105169 [Mangrovibacter plantisponsor]|uniref:Uncharacterized protein n=1 Tax=Mangrovibacter plantisponsor TaxID=451513 RepID=A0A317Q5Z0_9ENTR|nr:hypothetical protein DES37_105169 [Mangrovibacter plantisponsor]
MLKDQITSSKLSAVADFSPHIINSSVAACIWHSPGDQAMQKSVAILVRTRQQIRNFLFKTIHCVVCHPATGKQVNR